MKTLVLFGSQFALVATSCLACRCGETPSVEESVAQSDVIFVGRVTNLALKVEEDRVAIDVQGTFTELDVLKGDAGKRALVVATGPDEVACGYTFQLGDYYLVYARYERGELRTSVCTRTKTILGKIRLREGRDGSSLGDHVADMAGEKEADAVRKILGEKRPNKAPEPTPGAVTPRATEGASK